MRHKNRLFTETIKINSTLKQGPALGYWSPGILKVFGIGNVYSEIWDSDWNWDTFAAPTMSKNLFFPNNYVRNICLLAK